MLHFSNKLQIQIGVKMGTSSTIAILNNDGTVKSVYAHWYGYISNNGLILFQHYQDVNKVKELIALGSLSSLKPEINPPEGAIHNFDKPHDGVTNFYGRDRGEDNVNASEFSSLEDYVKKGDFQEFNYVFNEKENKWCLLNTQSGKLKELKTIILDDYEVSPDVKILIKNEKVFKELTEELHVNQKEPKYKI